MKRAGHGPWLYWPTMHIPQYWAQARLRHATGKRHGATVQRWGWSDHSQPEAEAHARQRAQQALDALLAAPKARNLDAGFERMEWRGEYGLDGATPIREEVLERRGNTVLTRNSYGAHCLNTEQVAIADMDYPLPPRPAGLPWLSSLLLLAALAVIAQQPAVWDMRMLIGVIAAAALGLLCLRRWQHWARDRSAGAKAQPPRQTALADIQNLAQQHPDWGLRVYETPKGLRVIVTHATFHAQAPEVKTLFEGLRVDPLYAMLCERQQCFRARVSAKPWRMKMSGLSTQERGWPLDAQRLPARQQWVSDYEQTAAKFAACRFVMQLGNPASCAEAGEFVAWHDAASRAQSELPLA